MTYALDTNILSFLLRRDKNQDVTRRFREEITERGNYYTIPPLSYYEVFWLLLRKGASAQIRMFNDLRDGSCASLDISEAEVVKAAEIRAYLEERGTPIGEEGNGDADIFIAAHCIVHGYTLVTDNVNDFGKIDDLKFVNWKVRD